MIVGMDGQLHAEPPGVSASWDDPKAASNLAKHGVRFEFAIGAFVDVMRVELDASWSAGCRGAPQGHRHDQWIVIYSCLYATAENNSDHIRSSFQCEGEQSIWLGSLLIPRTCQQ
jgi:uncharacterized DUF497 family protein